MAGKITNWEAVADVFWTAASVFQMKEFAFVARRAEAELYAEVVKEMECAFPTNKISEKEQTHRESQ